MSEYNTCTEPMFWCGNNCLKPEGIAQVGYQAGDNPAAEHENYFRRQTYLCIKELQSYLFNTADKITFQKNDDGSMYYLDSDGNRLTDVVRIYGIPYRFSNNGGLYTGWQTIFGKRYYYDPRDGNIVLGWVIFDDQKYYVTLMDGKLVNQYRTIDDIDYHFDASGAAQKV